MPTYQYSCTECGHFFEIFQSFSDDSLSVCPECEGRLRKVFNAVGVVFKGSGFYRNDSRTDGKSTGGGATPKAPATADSSGSNGSDSSSSSSSEKSSSPEKSGTTAAKSTSTDSPSAA